VARLPKTPPSPDAIQKTLVRTRIAPDLLAGIKEERPKKTTQGLRAAPQQFDVIIEFNRSFPGGTGHARETLLSAYRKLRNLPDVAPAKHAYGPAVQPLAGDDELKEVFGPNDTVAIDKSMWTDSYVFAHLSTDTINKLSTWAISTNGGPVPLVYKIWRDHRIERCVYESVRTTKCDAARTSFAADGKSIVWAVADTGIDGNHPHFKSLETTKLPDGLVHRDFTQQHPDDAASCNAALTDQDGHGTHVAGIIAGLTCLESEVVGAASKVKKILVRSQVRKDDETTENENVEHKGIISGMAPYCKLLSLKVLKASNDGALSNLMAAIGFIQRSNDNGRNLKIHGLNMSLGYQFDPEWFAAGQSPLCVEVDRLVRSGVCVVVAAGNGGYGSVSTYSGASERAAHMGTIADPGNATLAITVGSTHRNMPHTYGVSYFSAKGPTSDGRMKPDLIAPGERIVSCATTEGTSADEAHFREDSGTSMSAPHVSGAIAAFLSVRGEFKGKPEQVKDIFVQSATDLKRRSEFQGAGLLDLMRALQSV
jgi:serine protease AprX